MDGLNQFFNSIWAYIIGGGISASMLGSFAVGIISSKQAKKTAKENTNLSLSTQVKDEIIKAKDEQIAIMNSKIDKLVSLQEHQTNIITTSFMDSGVSAETKAYILSEANKIKEEGLCIKANLETKLQEKILEATDKAKEIKEVVDNVANSVQEKVNSVGEDTLNLYNKILEKSV